MRATSLSVAATAASTTSPRSWPERVVDRLEVVDVEQRERERPLVAQRARELLAQALVEGAVVGQARQRIGGGLLDEDRVGLGVGHGQADQLGEVVEHALGVGRQRVGRHGRHRDRAPQPSAHVHGRGQRAAVAHARRALARGVAVDAHGAPLEVEAVQVVAAGERQDGPGRQREAVVAGPGARRRRPTRCWRTRRCRSRRRPAGWRCAARRGRRRPPAPCPRRPRWRARA